MKTTPRLEERCTKNVYPAWSRGMTHHRCAFKAVRDGFCARHHPDAQRARDQEKGKRWDAKQAMGVAAFGRAVEATRLLKIAARHAPPKLKRRIEKFVRGEA